jgi:hypothetical protein
MDVIRYWGVSASFSMPICNTTSTQLNQVHFPTLIRIDCNYLAIQGSSVAPNQLFSGAGITGTDCHNSLTPTTFEALQVLKSAYKNGILSALDEAEACVVHLWANNDIMIIEDGDHF